MVTSTIVTDEKSLKVCNDSIKKIVRRNENIYLEKW